MRMRALELKISPPAVAAIVAFLMWGIARFTTSWEIPVRARGTIALIIAASGIAFSVAGFTTFRRAKTTINPRTPEAASSLVASGVYGITRNPMYLGLLLLLVGWAVFLSSGWALAGPAAFVAFVQLFQITPEERVLSALFGPQYSAYKAKVRRWI